jgi:DNA-binding CsgD family transcriptional regulator
MKATFTARDLECLNRAVGAASRPFALQSVDEWRADVMRACCELLDGDMGHFDLFGIGLDDPYFVDRYPPAVFDEWRCTWGPESDAAIDVTARLNLTVFTRAHRYRIAGDHWTARYKRSRLFNEYYAKHGFLHGGGLYYRSGETTAYLVVESGALASDAFDERARQLLRVVEPVFQSSVRSLSRTDGSHWTATALLDALDEPIALIGADGRWIHRSRPFESALTTIPSDDRPAFLDAMLQRGRALLRAAYPGAVHRGAALTQPVCPTWTRDDLTTLLTTVRVPGHPEPMCLVRLVMQSRASLAQATAAGLTDREAVVAMCLVDGLSNKEIARRLAISPHTVRRHTESILKKLGVSNRTSVARALCGTGQAAAAFDRTG